MTETGFVPPPSYFQHLVQLTPKQFGYVGSYSRDMLGVEQVQGQFFDQMVYRFTTSILSGRTVTENQRATVKVPAGWWQHLKKTADDWAAGWLRKPHPAWRLLILPVDVVLVPLTCLIPWFLRRHPVKWAELTAEVRFTRDTLYPGADVSLPASRFGAPVMYEATEITPSVVGGAPWELEGYGPARFLESREIASEIMRDPDLQNGGRGSFGMDPGTVFGVLDWLGRHGVSTGQIVARNSL